MNNARHLISLAVAAGIGIYTGELCCPLHSSRVADEGGLQGLLPLILRLGIYGVRGTRKTLIEWRGEGRIVGVEKRGQTSMRT